MAYDFLQEQKKKRTATARPAQTTSAAGVTYAAATDTSGQARTVNKGASAAFSITDLGGQTRKADKGALAGSAAYDLGGQARTTHKPAKAASTAYDPGGLSARSASSGGGQSSAAETINSLLARRPKTTRAETLPAANSNARLASLLPNATANSGAQSANRTQSAQAAQDVWDVQWRAWNARNPQSTGQDFVGQSAAQSACINAHSRASGTADSAYSAALAQHRQEQRAKRREYLEYYDSLLPNLLEPTATETAGNLRPYAQREKERVEALEQVAQMANDVLQEELDARKTMAREMGYNVNAIDIFDVVSDNELVGGLQYLPRFFCNGGRGPKRKRAGKPSAGAPAGRGGGRRPSQASRYSRAAQPSGCTGKRANGTGPSGAGK